MISSLFQGTCHIFLCYRNSGAETAKQFKKSLARNENFDFGYVWYSDQESVGNYDQDIHVLIPTAKFAILFISKDFTSGFVKDGQINYSNCITVKEIIEIEKNRQAGKLTVVAVHIDGYMLSADDLQILEQVFENENIKSSTSISAYKNLNFNPYYKRNTDMDYFAINFSKNMAICHNKNIDYKKTIHSLINWLVSIDTKWGPNEYSTIQQNANTCEALLSIKISQYDTIKRAVYQNALKTIINSITDDGLKSKTLDRETVTCTSLALLLFSMEHNFIKNTSTKINNIVNKLWSIRNPEYGWGTFCKYTQKQSCNFINTAWALLALSQYEIVNTKDFEYFCCEIYELETNGTFGYYVNDTPKITSTAMFLSVFYLLPIKLQAQIKRKYCYHDAIDFVLNNLINSNIQIEVMNDEDGDELQIKKAPWNNITLGASLSALALAREHNDINQSTWQKILNYTDNVINQNVKQLSENKIYYVPSNMPFSRYGHFTFPTAYLIWGLQMLDNVNDKLISQKKNA